MDFIRNDGTMWLSFEMMSNMWYILNKEDCETADNDNICLRGILLFQ